MARKNEKTVRPLRLLALKMLDDSELNAVAGGSKNSSTGSGAKTQSYLTYTLNHVVVSSISW